MNRLHMLIISLFAVALGTGIVVGMGMTRAPQQRDNRSWMAEQLGLSAEQQEQMKAVWEDVRGSSKPRNDARMQFRKERDDGLMALLTPEQKADYQKVLDHYKGQMAQLDREQDAEFQAAAERTKKILNDKQRAVYEDLLKKGFHGGMGGPRDGGRGGPPGPRGGRGPDHGPERGPDHGPDRGADHGSDGAGPHVPDGVNGPATTGPVG